MKPIIISDPYPRSLNLIFTKQKLQMLRESFMIITAPDKNKRKFYEKNISKATFIMGQPDLDKELLIKGINGAHSDVVNEKFIFGTRLTLTLLAF